MEHEMMEHSEILLYSDENGKEFVNVVFMDETFWLTQVGMAELFDSSKSNVSEHLSHIFDEEELDKASCMRKFGISEFSTKQPRRHHRRGLPRELQESHTLPPVGDKDAEGVHSEGLCAQR